ncbi:Hypothetical protein D9617_16g015070 [Elsinoe fawcettii]|nr:Hypothetical protein D9617_16g015070 [Elsinoe fawcettii]
MSAKLTEAERNRLKQQRSRARRKEYLTDLEERLRNYERQGVHATVEVQNAARHVVRENQALRKLLAQHDVKPTEIDAFLQADLGTPNSAACASFAPRPSSSQKQSTVTSKPQQASPAPLSTKASLPLDNSGKMHSAGAIAPEAQEGDCTQSSDVVPNHAPSSYPQSRPESAGESANLAHDERTDAMRSAVYNDQISCEEAAHVIASMRGAANAEDILPELGCSGSQKCMVKSSVVFELS